MQNINPKLLEALKSRGVSIEKSMLDKFVANEAKNLKSQKAQNSKNQGSEESLNSDEKQPNFRIRQCNSSQVDGEQGPNSIMRQSATLWTSGMKSESSQKSMMNMTGGFNSRPMTAQSNNSKGSSKGLFTRTDSTKLSEDDDMSDINFINMDEEYEKEAKLREEMEIFNDLADLTEDKLAELIDIDEARFSQVVNIDLKVDLSFNSLMAVGEMLPNLRILRLNGSVINSLRDIGNSFRKLEILYVSKCGLKNLAGLSSFPNLRELYAAYNAIDDLSDITYHETLQLLDLEGNEIKDLNNLMNLNGIANLIQLTLTSNPVSQIEDYSNKVLEMIPSLEYLDENTKEQTIKITKKKALGLSIAKTDTPFETEAMRESINHLYEKFKKYGVFTKKDIEDEVANQKQSEQTIKEPSEEELVTMSVRKTSKKAMNSSDSNMDHLSINANSKAKTLNKSMSNWNRPQTSQASFSGKKLGGGSIFTNADKLSSDTGISDLVQQNDKIFAGNPLKALRHRRQNQFVEGTLNEKGESVSKAKDIMKLLDEFEDTNRGFEYTEEDLEKFMKDLDDHSRSDSCASGKEDLRVDTDNSGSGIGLDENSKENLNQNSPGKLNALRQRRYTSTERTQENNSSQPIISQNTFKKVTAEEGAKREVNVNELMKLARPNIPINEGPKKQGNFRIQIKPKPRIPNATPVLVKAPSQQNNQ